MTSTEFMAALPVDQTLQRARGVRFSRVAITAIFGIFFVLGWATGRLWLGAVFCALAVSEGWREGTGRAMTQPGAPTSR
jgi:hypothetical protein